MARRVSNDWIMIGGHCHYAKDLFWFQESTYRKINPTVVDGEHTVVGIGNVTLTVRCSNKNSSVESIVLLNVLHIPDASCNGIEFKSVCKSHDIRDGKLFCYTESMRQLCYAIKIVGGGDYCRLVLGDTTIGMSYRPNETFLEIYLKKREMKFLFGRIYPFYIIQ